MRIKATMWKNGILFGMKSYLLNGNLIWYLLDFSEELMHIFWGEVYYRPCLKRSDLGDI